jgi:hypothetical protein
MYFTISGIILVPALMLSAYHRSNFVVDHIYIFAAIMMANLAGSIYFSLGAKNYGKRKFFSALTVLATIIFGPVFLYQSHTLIGTNTNFPTQYILWVLVIAASWFAVTII